MRQSLAAVLISLLLSSAVSADELNPDLGRLQGHWEVTELVEDGKVIPRVAIRDWLPSGGRIEITENAILFKSPKSNETTAKIFSTDATRYPKGLDITSKEKQVSQGIYRFDEDRLVVCVSAPASERPTDFSASQGSKRVLMVLTRTKKSAKPASTPKPTTLQALKPQPLKKQPKALTAVKPAPSAAPVILTDAQVKGFLVGVWQLNDGIGPIYATLSANGTFRTTRDIRKISLFQEVFVRTPVSSGTWAFKDGQLTYHVTSSTHLEKAGRIVALRINSISNKELNFADALGRTGKAVKVQ